MRWLLADWQDNKAQIFDGIEAGLKGLGYSTRRIPRSDMSRRAELIEAIDGGSFDVLLTWQRFYPMQTDLIEAVSKSGIRTVFLDFGFIPHYETVVFDSAGENASSSWPAMWRNGGADNLRRADLAEAERLIESESARARVLHMPTALENTRLPFIFVPLQRTSDAVIRYDSKYTDLGTLVRKVLLLAQSTYVVCKTHPLDRDLDLGVPDHLPNRYLILRTDFGKSNEEIGDFLLSKASLVVGINSNMLFRALLFGTPVIASGEGWYSGSGVFREVDGVSGLNDLMIRPPDLSLQIKYVATCLSRQLRFAELKSPAKLADVLGRIGIGAGAKGATR